MMRKAQFATGIILSSLAGLVIGVTIGEKVTLGPAKHAGYMQGYLDSLTGQHSPEYWQKVHETVHVVKGNVFCFPGPGAGRHNDCPAEGGR